MINKDRKYKLIIVISVKESKSCNNIDFSFDAVLERLFQQIDKKGPLRKI